MVDFALHSVLSWKKGKLTKQLILVGISANKHEKTAQSFIKCDFSLKNGLTYESISAYICSSDDNRSFDSSVAQWQSMRLLTAGLLVRVQPGELQSESINLVSLFLCLSSS